MAMKQLPPVGLLRQLLRYDFATGRLFWRERTSENCKNPLWFNSRNAGKEAFTATLERGYKVGLINGETYQAHRIIYKMVTGDDPGDYQVDHLNRNTSDNRFENLRLSSASENQANKLGKPNSTSRYKGVCKLKCGKFQGTLRYNKKRIHLGTFKCETAAAIAYDLEARRRYGEFALTNFRIDGAT